MQTFKGLDANTMDFRNFFASFEKGNISVIGQVEPATRHQGGPINAGGVYRLLPNEMVLDNQAVAALAQALTMVTMSQENAMAGGGNTTIISAPTQPITNLAQNSTNINQINVPESAVNNERTFRTVAHGQMARA
jgi:hypothetical protein